MKLRSLVLAVALASIPTLAAAQSAPPPQTSHLGFFGGGSLEAGNMSCSGMHCNTFRKAGGVSGHFGWGFNQKLALIFDIYVMTSKEDNLQITQSIGTIGARYWLVPILWVQAGVGGANAQFDYTGIPGFPITARSDNASGVLAAVGVEVLRTPRFELDVEGRLGYGFYPGNSNDPNMPDDTGRSTSLGVGATWY